MLEQTVNFTEQRHDVLLEDIANVSTPGYVEKDLSVAKFQATLRNAIAKQQPGFSDVYDPESNDEITFQPGGSAIASNPHENPNSIAFHDRGVRNMEYLMPQLADNALAHNMAAQFLKSRYDQISRAISMKV